MERLGWAGNLQARQRARRLDSSGGRDTPQCGVSATEAHVSCYRLPHTPHLFCTSSRLLCKRCGHAAQQLAVFRADRYWDVGKCIVHTVETQLEPGLWLLWLTQ